MLQLKFSSPSRVVLFKKDGDEDIPEIQSKTLDQTSKLYSLLTKLRERIVSECKANDILLSDFRPLHVELVSTAEHLRNLKTLEDKDKENAWKKPAPDTTKLLLKRVGALQDAEVALTSSSSWGFIGKALVLKLPKVEGYDNPHVTLARFERDSAKTEIFQVYWELNVLKMVDDLASQ